MFFHYTLTRGKTNKFQSMQIFDAGFLLSPRMTHEIIELEQTKKSFFLCVADDRAKKN